jgi:hypothetical protein
VFASNGSVVLAAGVHGARGWLARHGPGVCAVCVALHEGVEAVDVVDGEPSPTGVVASLLAFEILAAVLGWDDDPRGGWRRYHGSTMSLTSVDFTKHADCPVCGADDRSSGR